MPRTLITGVSGFVGRALAEHLNACGHTVIGLSRTLPACRSLLENFHQHGLDDVAQLRRIVDDDRVDVLIHLASTRQAASSVGIYDANVLGAARLLEAVTQSQLRPRVVLVGSSAIYGESVGRAPQDEHTALAPVTPYGVSKAAVDLMGLQVFRSSKVPVLRVRPFNIIGRGQRGDYVTAKCAKQLVEIEQQRRAPLIQLGNLDAFRDFLDVRDLVRALERVAERGEPGEAYNICSGHAVAIRALVQMFLDRAARKVTLESQEAASGDVSFQVGTFAKLSAATGWTPAVPLVQTVDDILTDWRAELALSPN